MGIRIFYKVIPIILIILFIFPTGDAQASNLLVPDQYTSIQAAIDAANPGDTVIVQSGVYAETLYIDKAITLTAQSFDAKDPTNNTTFIQGQGIYTSPYTISIAQGIVGTVTIRGFALSNANDIITAASDVAIEYNYFYLGNDLIDTEKGASGLIKDNVFYEAWDDGIDLDNIIHPITIEDNRIYRSHDDGIEIRLQASSAPPNLTDVVIKNNQIIGNNRSGIQFIDYLADPQDTNIRFSIFRNLFAHNKIAAISFMPNGQTVEDLSGADTIETVYAYNNTFYDNYYTFSGGDNFVTFNNIITQSRVGAWRVEGAGANNNSVAAYTLFYNNNNDAVQSSLGAGNIYAKNPMFLYPPDIGPDGKWNTPDDDYLGLVLAKGSPAIDTGVRHYKAANGDYVPVPKITKYNGKAPDLGWKESNYTPAPTPTAIPIIPTPTLEIIDPFISKSVEPPFALPGEAVTWTIQISNPSTQAAFNATVVDKMPSEVIIDTVSATDGTIVVEGQTITWSIGIFNPQANIAITIGSHISPDATLPYVITNNAYIEGDNLNSKEARATVLSISELPLTGQSPWNTLHQVLRIALILGVGLSFFAMMKKQRHM